MIVLVGATVVVLLFIQLNAPTTLAAQLQSYHVGADERQVLVTAVLTRADSIKSVSTKQDPTSVRVTVLVDRKRISPRSVVCGRVDCSREPVRRGVLFRDRSDTVEQSRYRRRRTESSSQSGERAGTRSPTASPARGIVTHENATLGYRISLPVKYRRALSVVGQNVSVDVYTLRTEQEDRELCVREQGSGLQSPERVADLRVAMHGNVGGMSALEFANAPSQRLVSTTVEPATIDGRDAAKVVHQPSGDTAYYVIRANDRIYEVAPLLVTIPSTQPKGWLDQIVASFRAIPFAASSTAPASPTALCGN